MTVAALCSVFSVSLGRDKVEHAHRFHSSSIVKLSGIR
jgi:hypothetical protein